jgi:hypothetical protein
MEVSVGRQQAAEGRPVIAAVLACLIVLGSAFLWIGIPLGIFLLAGELTSSAQGFLFFVLGGIPFAMIGFGWLLYRVNAVYEEVRGGPPRTPARRSAWLVASTEERNKLRRKRAPRTLIDTAMTTSAIVALVLLLVWFFFFATMHLAPMQ